MSNSLDPDQAQQNFGPDLNTNCLLLEVISRRMLSECQKVWILIRPYNMFLITSIN